MVTFLQKTLLVIIICCIASGVSLAGANNLSNDMSYMSMAADSTDCVFTCLDENITVIADPTTCEALVEIELVDFPIGVGEYSIMQMPAQVKSNSTWCPTSAVSSVTCDCPDGYVAVGYSAEVGNGYGANVISRYRLYCRKLNADGSLGSTIENTCYNGSLDGTTGTSGPVYAATGSVLVGAQLNLGCAMDRIVGRSKPVSQILANQANSSNTTMTAVGGTGGSTLPLQIVPNGTAIVGMVTYLDPSVNNISAGVAWRYANLNDMIDAMATCGTIVNSFNNTDNPSGTYPIGTTTVVYTFTDNDGNSTECTFDVNVLSLLPDFSFNTFENSLQVTFINESQGHDSLSWDFGDGNSSSDENPEHTYESEGIYNVCLTLMNACDTSVICQEVNVVCPVPTSDFSFSSEGLTVVFQNLSQLGDAYSWLIDGVLTNSNFDFQWEFQETGIYEVCLEVENNCGSAVFCDSIDLSCITPIVGFDFEQDGNSFSFSNTSEFAETFFWDFGDGSTSTEENPMHTYEASGQFEVCLTAMNDCEEETHCENVLIVTVQDHSMVNDFKLFPNPAEHLMTLQLSLSQPEVIHIEILDLLGRKIYAYATDQPFSQFERNINIESFKPGFYLLSVYSSDQIVTTRKFVIER